MINVVWQKELNEITSAQGQGRAHATTHLPAVIAKTMVSPSPAFALFLVRVPQLFSL